MGWVADLGLACGGVDGTGAEGEPSHSHGK
jgi:hypothetical protein